MIDKVISCDVVPETVDQDLSNVSFVDKSTTMVHNHTKGYAKYIIVPPD